MGLLGGAFVYNGISLGKVASERRYRLRYYIELRPPVYASMSAENLLAHFRRGPNGAWTAIKPLNIKTIDCEISIATGASFAPGSTVGGVDLVTALNAAAEGLGEPCISS